MAFIHADRVKEQSASQGFLPFVVTGALPGFRTFQSTIGDSNQCFFLISHDTDDRWEVGIGTVFGVTLTRDTVLASSNGGSPVNFAAGTKTVGVVAPAQQFAETLTTILHAAVDHSVGITGVPAPEAFDEAAHDVFDHSAQLGVPAPESFNNATHLITNHAGLDGVPDPFTPNPAEYGINRETNDTVIDLTSTTDSIHYLSMGNGGASLGTIDVNIPTTLTDIIPFLVIFNEDSNTKGAVLHIRSGAIRAPVVSLLPRAGVRLWHSGGLGNEYYAEPLTPLSAAPCEVLRIFFGDSLGTSQRWFIAENASPSASINSESVLEARNRSPILSPTRFMGIAWRSQLSGSPQLYDLSLLDQNEVLLAGIVLPIGITGAIGIDASINPVDTAATNVTTNVNLKYINGTARRDSHFEIYGFSRDGGLELNYAVENGSGSWNTFFTNGLDTLFISSPLPSEKEQVLPEDGVLDRLILISDNAGTITIRVNVNGSQRGPDLVLALGGSEGDLVHVLDGVSLRAGDRLSFFVSGTTAIGDIRLIARIRGPRGVVVPFGGDSSALELGRFGDANGGTANTTETTFVCPVALRTLRLTYITQDTGSVTRLELLRNGVVIEDIIVSEFSSVLAPEHRVVQLGSYQYAAGDTLGVTGVSLSGETHVLVQMSGLAVTE